MIERDTQNLQDKFEVQLLKMKVNQNEIDFLQEQISFTYRRDFTKMTVPQKELLREQVKRNRQSSWVCFQVSFYSVDQRLMLQESDGFTFVPQQTGPVVQTLDIIDNTGFSLLEDYEWVDSSSGAVEHGVKLYNTEFVQTFEFEYPKGATVQSINEKVVACSYYVLGVGGDSFSFDMASNFGYWSIEGCQTFYFIQNSEIQCKCENVNSAYYTLMKPTF